MDTVALEKLSKVQPNMRIVTCFYIDAKLLRSACQPKFAAGERATGGGRVECHAVIFTRGLTFNFDEEDRTVVVGLEATYANRTFTLQRLRSRQV
jgi:hypothetical protein